MKCCIFYYHPYPTVKESQNYSSVQMKTGRHWRSLYVRAELFEGTLEEAEAHAEKTKLPAEIVLKCSEYEK